MITALAVLVLLLTTGVFSSGKTWARRFSISVDILTFSLFQRQYDVTISSWCGLQLRDPSGNKFGRALGRVLDHLQTNHCEEAITADMGRAHDALIYLHFTNFII